MPSPSQMKTPKYNPISVQGGYLKTNQVFDPSRPLSYWTARVRSPSNVVSMIHSKK